MREPTTHALRQKVREQYRKVAEQRDCGCATTCCSVERSLSGALETDPAATSRKLGYSDADTGSVPVGANLGLGCGNPLTIAALGAGQTVLDLGSGAGFDAFLAAQAVGPTGLVIGVDMAAEMIDKARQNAAKGGYSNVEFRLGEIENLPVADRSVDAIISNCVVNLSPDKEKVFREAFRVLKPGGRLAIADILASTPMPDSVRRDLELYAGCVAGASLIDDVKKLVREAGFVDIRVELKPQSLDFIREWFPGRAIEDYIVSATIQAVKE